MEQGSALWGGEVGQGHMTVAVDVFRRQEIPDAAREHSRAQWTPGGTFADASGVSVGGNTVFIATKSYDENGDVTAIHVPGVASRSIARPLGNCPGSMYTGALADPLGSPGAGCGFAYADISWGMARYGRESLFLALDHPLGEGADAYLDIRAARDKTLERYAPSVGTFSVTSETLRTSCCPIPRSTRYPRAFACPIALSATATASGLRRWRNTTSRSAWRGSSQTASAMKRTYATTATIRSSTAIPS